MSECDGLRLETLRIELDGRPLVSLDSRIAPGEISTIMAPSGAGKSTLLAMVIGTPLPDFQVAGRIVLGGHDITGLPPHQRHIGILFQDELLFPHLSVGGNLAFGLPASIRGRAARQVLIDEALADIGLEAYANRDPATLSGGQRARVSLIRMLLSQPMALLLDEPFSRLDAALRGAMRELVFSRARQRGLPVLLVTHDEADARAAGGPVHDLFGQPVL